MTENERAINTLNVMKKQFFGKTRDVLDMVIQALEEIQQYRALEEKLNGISVEQVVNGFISTVEKQTHEDYKRGRILTNKEADEWNELQAIGTVEEFKVLKEKNELKKPIYSNFDDNGNDEVIPYKAMCPVCGHEFNFGSWNEEENHHCRCGQAIDWQ